MSSAWSSPEFSGKSGKRSFRLRTPLMPAAGFLGYGRAYAGIIEPGRFGAIVTQPTMLRAYAGQTPRFARLRGAFLRGFPPPNPGVEAVLREFAPSWRRWQVPIIVAIFAETVEDAISLAERLEREESVAALELQVPASAGEEWLREILEALVACTDLPVLAKLPLASAASLAAVAIAHGPAGLVIGTPHVGYAPAQAVSGPLYGPATLPYTLEALHTALAALGPDLPLIASGGIYAREDVETCLSLGAAAVQIDGLIFLDPAGVAQMAREFSPDGRASSASV